MKKSSTLLLKIVIVLMGIPVLAVCIFLLPIILKDAAESSYKMAYVLYSISALMYITAIPYFYSLYQGMLLLKYIDYNNAFSDLAITSLKKIKISATIISLVYFAGMPLFFILGEVDDAPGVILMGMIFIFAPGVIAVFAAVLQKLLQNAIDFKTENELTI